jgi:hypothetical protein
VQTSADTVRELARGTSCRTCAIGNIVIAFSSQSPEPAYLETASRAINQYAAAHPPGLGVLALIDANEPPPDERTRQALLAMRAAIQERVLGSVIVIEGQGFAASAKRGVVAMLSLTTAPFPTRVAGSLHEGAAKMVKLLGPKLDDRLDVESVAAAVIRTRSF